MSTLVRGANPIWFENNLIGAVFDDKYYAFFLTNDLPYNWQTVWSDPNGAYPWSQPIEYQASGGLPDNIYFTPGLAYRIEFRQGPLQTSPLIGNPIQNYIAGEAAGAITDFLQIASNQITNPQFADIFFSPASGVTFDTAGTYHIGPGWFLTLMGSGTTIIAQGTNPGSDNIPGNPAYYLTLNNSGWESAILYQKFGRNGAIFDGGAISVAFTAAAVGSTQVISVNYVDSNGVSVAIFGPGSIAVGSLIAYSGATDIVSSSNPDVGTNAYVEIQFDLQGTGEISFSNIQITGQSTPLSDEFTFPVVYQEQTYERTLDQEFHTYFNSITIEPKNSILTGWDFALNPWQFTNPTIAAATTQVGYYPDQTILYQQAASSVNIGQSGANLNNILEIQALGGVNRFALIQYIDPSTVLPYWNNVLSGLVKAALVTTQGSVIPIKMRLIWRTTLPPTISITEPIASWGAVGTDPVLASGWNYILAQNDPSYVIGSTNGGTFSSYAFNKFILPTPTTDTMTLGVMVYTDAYMSTTGPDKIFIDSVSLVPNEFAIDTNPLTFDETLRECQFYYESSFPYLVYPSTASFPYYTGAVTVPMTVFFTNANGTSENIAPKTFYLPYKQTKRFSGVSTTSPKETFYSPSSGTAGNMSMGILRAGAFQTPGSGPSNPFDIARTTWTNIVTLPSSATSYTNSPTGQMQIATSTSSAGSLVISPPSAGQLSDEGVLMFHYTVGARLGLANET